MTTPSTISGPRSAERARLAAVELGERSGGPAAGVKPQPPAPAATSSPIPSTTGSAQ